MGVEKPAYQHRTGGNSVTSRRSTRGSSHENDNPAKTIIFLRNRSSMSSISTLYLPNPVPILRLEFGFLWLLLSQAKRQISLYWHEKGFLCVTKGRSHRKNPEEQATVFLTQELALCHVTDCETDREEADRTSTAVRMGSFVQDNTDTTDSPTFGESCRTVPSAPP